MLLQNCWTDFSEVQLTTALGKAPQKIVSFAFCQLLDLQLNKSYKNLKHSISHTVCSGSHAMNLVYIIHMVHMIHMHFVWIWLHLARFEIFI